MAKCSYIVAVLDKGAIRGEDITSIKRTIANVLSEAFMQAVEQTIFEHIAYVAKTTRDDFIETIFGITRDKLREKEEYHRYVRKLLYIKDLEIDTCEDILLTDPLGATEAVAVKIPNFDYIKDPPLIPPTANIPLIVAVAGIGLNILFRFILPRLTKA